MPDIVAIQQESMCTELKKSLFHEIGDGAFARAAESGEPNDATPMLIAFKALLFGHGLFVPNNTWVLTHWEGSREGLRNSVAFGSAKVRKRGALSRSERRQCFESIVLWLPPTKNATGVPWRF